MASDQSSSSESSEVIASELPSEYEFLEVLGEGNFGQVVKCRKRDTEQIVAVKIPKGEPEDTIDEVSMMRSIKHHEIDTNNIVEFIDDFPTELGPALVFEALDISLFDYLDKVDGVPMLLSDIRTVIQQMATALDALKGIGVIHTDVKLDNIMMVNHQPRPFKFKLIDFGLAISRSEAEQGTILQPCCLRAPEIILGLPFSEAIDMWALGCEMFLMVCGDSMCEGECDYEIVQDFYRCVPAHRYGKIRKHAQVMLSLFGSTYVCEQAFSLMNLNKSKLRNALSDSHLHDILTLSVSQLEPDIERLLKTKDRLHVSH